jgi:hypothetical protein
VTVDGAVADYLYNMRGGLIDATCAFHDLDDEDEE